MNTEDETTTLLLPTDATSVDNATEPQQNSNAPFKNDSLIETTGPETAAAGYVLGLEAIIGIVVSVFLVAVILISIIITQTYMIKRYRRYKYARRASNTHSLREQPYAVVYMREPGFEGSTENILDPSDIELQMNHSYASNQELNRGDYSSITGENERENTSHFNHVTVSDAATNEEDAVGESSEEDRRHDDSQGVIVSSMEDEREYYEHIYY